MGCVAPGGEKNIYIEALANTERYVQVLMVGLVLADPASQREAKHYYYYLMNSS
jgi:hypothetical protein